MINGNIQGIRQSVLEQMEAMLEIECDRDTFLPEELLLKLARFTGLLGREIAVYISRGGSILDVTVGDSGTVSLGEVKERRSLTRLSGVRCIHTHPGGDSTLSSVDLQSLQRLKLDAMAALGVTEEGEATALSVAFLDEPAEAGQYKLLLTKPFAPGRIPQSGLMEQIRDADRRIADALPPSDRTVERALVVGLADSEDAPSLLELERLAETAGAQVAARICQNRAKMDSATYIGSGKARDLSLLVGSADIDLIIVDDELTGAQVRNLEEIVGCRVVDRTALILDIFAQRASSREGKLQVELAQMKYQLPRLSGLGVVMSRLGGGIGTRGPGETKLEVDRRRIRRRITDITRELSEVKRQRNQRRERRERNEVPVVAIVGYTNAGKSSLLNLLSGANVAAEDKLFMTLDPVTRRLTLPCGMDCLMVDTVGFISKLPHDLVNAFQSTLEEALYADLLLIVQDISDENFLQQQEVVFQVLSDLGAGDKPMLRVLNKHDLAPEAHVDREGAVLLSAKTGEGVDELLDAIQTRLRRAHRTLELDVPYLKGDVVSYLHKYGTVQSEDYTETGTHLVALVDAVTEERVRKMLNQ
jgi:GTP-binding protein HflX